MPNWKKVIVSGSDASLKSVSVNNQSTFDAGVTINGTNSTLYNNVAFIDLNGVSGSRIDLHGKNSINTITTDIDNLSILVPSGSAVFEVDKGSFEIYASQSIYLSSDVTSSANILVSGSVLIGTSSFTENNNERLLIDSGVTNSYNLITARTNVNNYSQFNITNKNTGSSASTDIVATNNIGTEGTYYVDLGINGSNFVGAVGEANDAYLYTTGSNLLIGNITPGKDVKLFTSGGGFVEITSGTKITGSLLVSGSSTISGSFNVSGSTIQTGNNTLIGNTSLTGSINVSGSQTFVGTNTITGSVLISGSTTQIGNNTLLGDTSLSGSIIISGSYPVGSYSSSVNIYGDTTMTGYLKFNPQSTNINTNVSASYIYVSGSTNDLYFTQNGNGYNNTTRLRWLEGNLYTGLLNGGLITATTGSTTFNLSSGSGIIVNLNASLNDNPYPTIKYVNWGNFTSQPLTYLTSSIQSYIGIDENGQITQQTTAFNDGTYNEIITIGSVIHQNKSTVNASITYPNVAYGYKQRTYDFIKAFGPLKLSGLNINVSSSLGLTIGSGTAFADGRNYQVNPNNPSYITDSGTTISKIFRYYQSGSDFVQDTNGGVGYTVIDPTNYNPGGSGSLTPVPGTGINREWSIQRVFWYPNSATKGIVVYYGTSTYANEIDAAANINYEQFLEVENTKQNAVYLGAIVIRNDGNFTDVTSYKILPGGVFRNVGGSGGGGNITSLLLSQLGDVSISSPTSGQALIYDITDLKWKNLSFISASISGNAASATSASYALSSSYAITSSYSNKSTLADSATTATTASYVLNAISSSFTTTASYSNKSSLADLATNANTASLATQINVNSPALTGGNLLYVLNSGSADVYTPTIGTDLYYNDGQKSLNVTSSFAYTASYASNADLLDGLNSAAFALTGSTNRFTANQIITGSLTTTGDIITQGNIVAQQYIVSSSVAYFTESFSSGSTKFGNSADDTHQFTGSVSILGSLNANLTGSVLGTGSYALSALSSSYAIKASSADSATNASTASYVLNAVSASFTTNASTASYINQLNQNVSISGSANVSQSISTPLINVISGSLNEGIIDINNSINSWIYSGKSFSIGGQETAPVGVFFKSDGTKMYINGSSGDDINEYNLGTPWDVTTAVFSTLFSTAGQDTAPSDLFFSSDGTRLYVAGDANNTIFQYSLGTAWDISTTSYSSISFSVAAKDTNPSGIWFKSDGTKMYVCGFSSDSVHEYDLGTAWNVSTATFLQSFSVSSQDTVPASINFNNDGTKFYIVGSTNDNIYEYNLGTPWNISTAAYYSRTYIGNQEATPTGLYVTTDNVYIVGSTNDIVYQYYSNTNALRLTSDSLILNTELVSTTGSVSIDQNLDVLGKTNLVGATTAGSVTTSTLTVNGTLTSTSTTTLASSTAAQTVALGAGATLAATTKTINIGTSGVATSITNVNIGSAVAGALGTITLNHNTLVTGSLTVFSGSAIDFQVTDTGTKIGNLITDSHTITGSVNISGSVTAVGFTGPLTGTASYASQALNASTASYVVTANTASYVLQAVSASFATTASYSNKSSLADNATNATNATTASYVLQAVSSSFATNASTASYVATASYALSALSSSYAIRSTDATTALTASYVSLAQTASYANLLDGYDSTDFARLAAANRFTANQIITGSLTATGDIITQGNLVAQQFIISSSVTYFTESFSSGSTKFGDTLDDTHQLTGSVNITGSFTLNGNQLITGSATIGSNSLGASENTLTLGARDNGSEGGQLGLLAPGGTYTSASMIDNYQNAFRVLTGTNAGSNRMDLELSHGTQNLRIFGDVIAYAASDKRLKENINPIENALDKVSKIGGYTFDWNDQENIHGHKGNDIGVIAQEIEDILPEVVTTRDNGYKAVKYEKIVPLLIQAIKELKAEVESLKSGNYNKWD